MKLSNYLQEVLSNFSDSRVIVNIQELVNDIIEHKSIRLWSNSEDKAGFERSKRLLDGSLKSVLDNEKISSALRSRSVHFSDGKERLILLHDPCDIRKEYSKQLEKIGKVRSLKGEIINGYSTFNTVCIDEKAKQVRLVDISVYSNGDEHYITEEELKSYNSGRFEIKDKKERIRYEQIEKFIEEENYVNLNKLAFFQIRKVSKTFKGKDPKISICHVLDRQFDDVDYFELITEELEDDFVIRMRISRNSNESLTNQITNEKQQIKLKDINFSNKDNSFIEKLIIKNKVYQQVTCVIEWGEHVINENVYTVVRVSLIDRKGKNIFKEPMLLLTNISVKNSVQARMIYRIYLMRSKIESVFKFLKDVLGWEEFQVRDFQSIKNIIALCFFVGGYFYEIESELTQNTTIQLIAQLGDGKGKVTRYYFLQGLKKILIHQTVEQFVKEQNITDEDFEKMLAFVT